MIRPVQTQTVQTRTVQTPTPLPRRTTPPPSRAIAPFGTLLSTLALATSLAGCAVGPNYKRPPVEVPAAFKEAGNWTEAQPQDHQPRGPWWEIFGDATLNGLASQVDLSNQDLKAAEARYRQAQAAAQVARSAFFPEITANASASRQQSSSRSSNLGTVTPPVTTPGTTPTTTVRSPVNAYTASLDVNWELDIWGRIRRENEAGRATAEESQPSTSETATTYTLTVPTDSSFLVAHLTPRTGDAAQQSSGSSRHGGVGIGVKGGYIYPSFSNARSACSPEFATTTSATSSMTVRMARRLCSSSSTTSTRAR